MDPKDEQELYPCPPLPVVQADFEERMKRDVIALDMTMALLIHHGTSMGPVLTADVAYDYADAFIERSQVQ